MPARTRTAGRHAVAGARRGHTEERLAALERLLDAQREELSTQRELAQQQQGDLEARLAAQQGEIERLHAERAAAPASPLILPAKFRGRDASADDAGPGRANSRHASRRGLLKLGGAAAAAGLAAAAAGELLRPGAAHAAPVPTGGPFILGQFSNADHNTGLVPTAGSTHANLDTLLVLDGRVAPTPNGLVALTSGATGVIGNDTAGGTGVLGTSSSGTGVQGQSDSGPDLFAGGGAKGWGAIAQQPWASTGVPGSGLTFGVQLRDLNGDMWLGTGLGNRLVATLAPGNKLGGSINLLPVAARLLDTRGGSPVAYHGTVQFHAGGVGGIPAGAVAVLGHVAAALRPGVNPGDGSSAILWPAGQTRPAAVNIVYNGGDLQGEYTGTLALVAIGAGGQISLYSQPILPGVAVDYLFDAFGFVM